MKRLVKIVFCVALICVAYFIGWSHRSLIAQTEKSVLHVRVRTYIGTFFDHLEQIDSNVDKVRYKRFIEGSRLALIDVLTASDYRKNITNDFFALWHSQIQNQRE